MRTFHVIVTLQLHTGEGPIHAIQWRSNFIAWANDLGVKVYDTTVNSRIAYVDRPKGRWVWFGMVWIVWYCCSESNYFLVITKTKKYFALLCFNTLII